jgi:hypothetical protein
LATVQPAESGEILSLLKANTRIQREKVAGEGKSYVSGLRYASWGSKVAASRFSVEIPDR